MTENGENTNLVPTESDMYVGMIGNSDKLIEEKQRWNYNRLKSLTTFSKVTKANESVIIVQMRSTEGRNVTITRRELNEQRWRTTRKEKREERDFKYGEN